MQFGTVAVAAAEGALLAHATDGATRRLRKGHRLTAADIADLLKAGIAEVTVARLDADDVGEDEAAARIAAALAGPGLAAAQAATGRCNLHADAAGLLVLDRAVLDALNRVDPAITVATLPEYAVAEPGRMVATVKIIPFAVPADRLAAALARLGAPALTLAPFRPRRIAVVSTLLPILKPSVVDKTLKIMAERVAPTGSRVVADRRVTHAEAPLAATLKEAVRDADLIVVFGASAVVDEADVIPAAIVRAGGKVRHLGMPVDPGNLLILAEIAGKPVLGAPGCARSPKENGFDWVLQRLLAGLDVTPDDVMGLGVGGLLMDVVSRPAAMAAPVTVAEEGADSAAPRVAALVLAAGRGTRMAGGVKQTAEIAGKPLVGHAVAAARDGGCSPVVVVTGHAAPAVRAAVGEAAVTFVHNGDYAEGMATSLKAGLAALPGDVDAVVVLLADMPHVDGALVRRLAAAYDPLAGKLIAVPVAGGRRGNPVLIARRFFDELKTVTGDVGARDVIRAYPEAVVEVPADVAALTDLDTPEALTAAGGRLAR
jgi:molybdenum cofactor cytidylyltransferase